MAWFHMKLIRGLSRAMELAWALVLKLDGDSQAERVCNSVSERFHALAGGFKNKHHGARPSIAFYNRQRLL